MDRRRGASAFGEKRGAGMNYGRMSRTGRENRAVFFCRACGARHAAVSWPLAAVGVNTSTCEGCGRSLWFVAYEDGRENEAAEALISSGFGKSADG